MTKDEWHTRMAQLEVAVLELDWELKQWRQEIIRSRNLSEFLAEIYHPIPIRRSRHARA